MSPPGKNSGEMTCASVAITSRWPGGGAGSTAPSLPSRSAGLSKARANSSSISCAAARPPAPWFMSMRPVLKSIGRR